MTGEDEFLLSGQTILQVLQCVTSVLAQQCDDRFARGQSCLRCGVEGDEVDRRRTVRKPRNNTGQSLIGVGQFAERPVSQTGLRVERALLLSGLAHLRFGLRRQRGQVLAEADGLLPVDDPEGQSQVGGYP